MVDFKWFLNCHIQGCIKNYITCDRVYAGERRAV